jgi:two-component system, NarL family, sensor kinase
MGSTCQGHTALISRLLRRTLLWTASAWLFLNPGKAALAAEAQKSVLAIFGDRSSLPGNVVVDRTIRSTLAQQFDVGIDIHSEYVDVQPLDQTYPALRDFLRSKYAGKRFDVILAVGIDGLRFVRDYGRELFPGVPVVAWGGREVIENWNSGPPVTGVLEPTNTNGGIKGALGFICKLQPEAEQLFVVSGASRTDRELETIAREDLGQSQGGIVVTYLAGLPLADLQTRLTTLPGKSAILFLTMTEDGMGTRLSNRDVLMRISPAANAPVYALGTVQLGTGILGSLLVNQERMAQETAEIMIRILRGERVEDIPIRESRPAPAVDWRQLRRWNIPESRLPPGTDLLYKEPSPWDLYKWRIIGVISLCAVEGFLIIALLAHRARRKRAEKAMRESERLLQSTIDALNAHVVLLDEDCKIIAVNQSWRRFAESNGYAGADKALGRNYLEVCESKLERNHARLVSDGIRCLLSGELDDFRFVFPGRHSNRESWYQLRMNRFYTDGLLRLVVAHENVTEIKQAHDAQQQLSGLLLRAQDEERRRIARDLHDVTAQNLASMKADLTRVRKESEVLGANAVEPLRESMLICDQVIQELRTLSYLLHPPLLDELGLVPALQWFVRGFIERSGIQVQILVAGNIGRLAADVETAFFRVVQESLTNIHRHSGSPHAVIWVTKEQDEVILRIKDEGHGIPGISPAAGPVTGPLPGVGILGMRQRLEQLGGRLEIESGSKGTTITARISISEERYAPHSGII